MLLLLLRSSFSASGHFILVASGGSHAVRTLATKAPCVQVIIAATVMGEQTSHSVNAAVATDHIGCHSDSA